MLEYVKVRRSREPEFMQAIIEVLTSIEPVLDANP